MKDRAAYEFSVLPNKEPTAQQRADLIALAKRSFEAKQPERSDGIGAQFGVRGTSSANGEGALRAAWTGFLRAMAFQQARRARHTMAACL